MFDKLKKPVNWKVVLGILLLLFLQGFFKAMFRQETNATSPSTEASTTAVNTFATSRDSKGIELDDQFLRSFEVDMREGYMRNLREAMSSDGYDGSGVTFESESLYLDAGGRRLGVVQIYNESLYLTVIIGIVGDQFKQVGCQRNGPEPILIANGPCGDKVSAVFGSLAPSE